MARTVKIRWLTRGVTFINGEAFWRDRGDEDFLPKIRAAALVSGGKAAYVKEDEAVFAEVMDDERDEFDTS